MPSDADYLKRILISVVNWEVAHPYYILSDPAEIDLVVKAILESDWYRSIT